MGREKKGLDWFPLDCVMNTSIDLLEAEFGIKGFAVFVKILQKIYGDRGYYCEWNSDVELLFSRKINEGRNFVADVVKTCVKRGIFDKDLLESEGVLTSSSIQKVYLDATKRRVNSGAIEERLLIHNAKNKDDVDINSDDVDIKRENVDSLQQRRGEERRVEDKKSSCSSSTRPPKERIDYKGIQQYWNEHCRNMSKIRAVTDQRKQKLRTLLNHHTKKELQEAILKAEASDMMNGDNDRNWTASFDFVINPTNIQKILEGNYDNKAKSMKSGKQIGEVTDMIINLDF